MDESRKCNKHTEYKFWCDSACGFDSWVCDIGWYLLVSFFKRYVLIDGKMVERPLRFSDKEEKRLR